MIVRCPFSTTYTRCVVAKSLATSIRLACTSSIGEPISRAISPGCGVMITSRSSRPTRPSGIVGEHGDRVGVEHERHGRAVEQRADELARRRAASEAGTAGDDVVAQLEHALDRPRATRPVRRFRQRLGHVFRRHRGDDRQRRGRRRDRDEPRARSQRGHRRQVRRAGLAARPGHDRDAAEVALVRVGGARLHDVAQLLGRQQLDVLSLERRRSPRAECRCRR